MKFSSIPAAKLNWNGLLFSTLRIRVTWSRSEVESTGMMQSVAEIRSNFGKVGINSALTKPQRVKRVSLLTDSHQRTQSA